MSGKRQERTYDEQWLTAAWALARDVQAREGHIVQISLTPDRRRGVWRVEARLLDSVDGKPVGIARRHRGEFPTAAQARLSAALYAWVMQLDISDDLPMFAAPRGDP